MHEHKINISELRVIMNYIGIDLGTSAVKLLLMEGSGKILKIVSREYPICFPKPGWSEQNPYDWFTQSMDGTLDGEEHKRLTIDVTVDESALAMALTASIQ